MSTLDLGKVKLTWKGTWNSASSYALNDVVSLNGGIYICTNGHNAGVGNELAPGRRDRFSSYGKTVDPDELIVYNVTVQTFSGNNFFYIDGVKTPQLVFYPNVRYRFVLQDPSNLNHRFALSNVADGIFGVGGTELTSGIVYQGTPGIDGSVLVQLPSNSNSNIYYYSANDVNYGAGATGRLVKTNSWRGWQFWDLMTAGFNWKGPWSNAATYFINDMVEYQGATYLALADSFNKQPSSPMNNHNWLIMVSGDRRTEHNSIATFMNKGPLDWPYPNGHPSYPNAFGQIKWISRSGRIYHNGPGNFSHGLDQTNTHVTISHAQELCFNHHEWWASRDNGGSGRMTTPDGQPPRCIQIEAGNQFAHFLFNNGEVWGVGSNGEGALGNGNFSGTYISQRVLGLQDVKIVKISACYGTLEGVRHVLALDEYGYVWSWGRNNVGQLGHGHTQDVNQAQRIPRSYFGGERIIDIIAMGGNSVGHSYARTSSDNLYAWGDNGAGQLGDGTTTTRYRPIKMLNWDPTANNGILKWQAAHWSTSASFMILDGNRFLWGTGEDVGQLAQTSQINRTQLTKTTAAPGGFIQDFWMLWSYSVNSNKITFIRHTNGTTFVCGLGSNNTYVNGLNAITTAVTTGPQLIPVAANIFNLREVMLSGSLNSQDRTIHFLLENGRVLTQGYNGYGLIGQPERGTTSNPTDESGSTSYPVTTYLPPGTRIRQLTVGGSQNTNNFEVHAVFYLTESGQILGNGMNRNSSGARNSQFQSFYTYNQNPGEASSMTMPVSISYAR